MGFQVSSESVVRVTILSGIRPHPNADRLDVAFADGGYPVITKRNEYVEGAMVVYVPVDTMIPVDGEFSWLSNGRDSAHRVRAKRLRGIFSMGLVLPALPSDAVGDIVGERYGMFKYEPPGEDVHTGGEPLDDEPSVTIPKYDIEGWRKFGNLVFQDPNEEVVATEKLHGGNARFMWHGGRLRAGSRSQWKLPEGRNDWAAAARKYGLRDICEKLGENIVLYGELLGVQDLRYGFAPGDPGFFVFDVFDANTGTFWPHDTVVERLPMLPHVRVLWRGPVADLPIAELVEGKTTVDGAEHVREGVVVKPTSERYSEALNGRAILKLHGEGYLTR